MRPGPQGVTGLSGGHRTRTCTGLRPAVFKTAALPVRSSPPDYTQQQLSGGAPTVVARLGTELGTSCGVRVAPLVRHGVSEHPVVVLPGEPKRGLRHVV